MKNSLKILALLIASTGISVYGTPTLGFVETWGSGLGTGGDWQYSVVGDGGPYALGNVGSTLQLTLPDTTVPLARVYADGGSSGGAFSGDFYSLATGLTAASSNLVVSFNLASVDNSNPNPGAMVLYFVSSNGNRYVSSTILTQPAVGSNELYHVYISQDRWWNNLNSGNFALDFGSVSQFGLQLLGSSDTTSHSYQLDNFGLTSEFQVPEPETIWMMVMVLGSLAITFRGRLTDIGAQVRERFTS